MVTGQAALAAPATAPAPAQPLAEFQVNVINNTGERAKIQERQRPGGGRQIDVIVGELAAKDVLRGGPLHRAIRLAFAVNLINGLAAALPYALAYFAGKGRALASQPQRTLERRHAQLQIRRPGDRAVLDGLRRSGF